MKGYAQVDGSLKKYLNKLFCEEKSYKFKKGPNPLFHEIAQHCDINLSQKLELVFN